MEFALLDALSALHSEKLQRPTLSESKAPKLTTALTVSLPLGHLLPRLHGVCLPEKSLQRLAQPCKMASNGKDASFAAFGARNLVRGTFKRLQFTNFITPHGLPKRGRAWLTRCDFAAPVAAMPSHLGRIFRVEFHDPIWAHPCEVHDVPDSESKALKRNNSLQVAALNEISNLDPRLGPP